MSGRVGATRAREIRLKHCDEGSPEIVEGGVHDAHFGGLPESGEQTALHREARIQLADRKP